MGKNSAKNILVRSEGNIGFLELNNPEKLITIMVKNGMVATNSEARRMIAQGGVKINKKKVDDIHAILTPGADQVIKVGKRKFLKIVE